MDIDDPIQQFLKNTGWSCDDLLEKLQKYKSQKEKKDSEETVQETKGEKFVYDGDKGNVQEKNYSKEPTFCCDENTDKIKDIKNPITELEKEFSDTDEEEVEVNVTNSNIIDEIIDDIASVSNNEELNNVNENTTQESAQNNNEELEEVTEVRVIEVDDEEEEEEEEDDYFEEECCVEKHNASIDSKNVEYLETFPRKTPIKLIDLTNIDEKDGTSREKNITEENDKKSISEDNSSDNITDTKNSDIYPLTTIVSRKDGKTDTLCSYQNSNENCPKEITASLDRGNDEVNTTIIYKTNSEKIICDKSCTTLDKVENKDLHDPTSVKNDNQDENFVEDNAVLTNLEDIRNNLKLQLNSLRTRKRGHFLEHLRSKVVDPLKLNINRVDSKHFESEGTISETANTEKNIEVRDYFKKLPATNKEISEGHNLCTQINDSTTSTTAQTEELDESTDRSKKLLTNKENNQEHDLYTQTNEFGLVILSVEGGIDVGEENNESKQDINDDSLNTVSSALENSTDSNSFVLQNSLENIEKNEASEVFDEIRKIIRKQKQSSSVRNEKTGDICKRKFNCFSANVSSLKLQDESNEKIECSSASADNSQSSFTCDEASQNIEKNSPFVSNTLDEFLTGNSKLNISYNIPKSGAEEGLIDSYHDESPLILKKLVEVHNENVPTPKKSETIKAKTVAQKRKLLERQRLKELKKQATVSKRQFQKEYIVNTSKTPKQKKSSYIEINNKKLWVKGTKPNICVAKIYSPMEMPSKNHKVKKKLSLLTDLAKKCSEKIKYRPGPLSKKSALQLSGNDNWKTETKLLPKIILEVTPKIGQGLPSSIISRLPQSDGVITADLAEFALSVLKTKDKTNTENKTFRFPVKFMNNQEKIIVKKQKIAPLKYNIEEKNNEDKCINTIVANVVDNLIRYVEIKEIAPTLIKEDDIEYSHKDGKVDKVSLISDNVSSIIKKPQKKRSKVELELLRLNCKVVNVEVEQNLPEELCDKSYCQLGCVCKSLKCDGMITYHCQNVGCMLECKCPREKSIEYDKLMLPAGTDILSNDTVTRIEDEAKKDLAKVEREFTQMVIHTNDKTIVVGTGGRHKTRRSTKIPVKYSDYIDTNFEYEYEKKVKTRETKNFSKDCFVSLEKLNLLDIVPYCMFHNLYSCHCQEKSLPKNDIKSSSTKISSKPVVEMSEKKPITEKKYLKNVKVSPPKQSQIQKERLNNLNVFDNSPCTETKLSTSGRLIRINKKLKDDFTFFSEPDFQVSGCARTLGVHLSPNTNRRYSYKRLNRLIKNDFSNNITQSEILKSELLECSPETLEVDILKRQLVLESQEHKKSMSLLIEKALQGNKHKRKQTLEVRNDDASTKPMIHHDLALQRRRKTQTTVTKKNTIIEPVFDGEIIVDERNMDLLQKMGTRTVSEGYARLLPWRPLMNSFNKGDVKIWCMVDQPSRLLINKGDKAPPKNYVDIRKTTQTTEVILWILNNKLPQRYHEDHISFILKQTKDNYEICGLCTKNLNDTNSTISEKELTKVNTDKDTGFFKHKDFNGVQQLMCLSKDKFKLQELVEETLAAFGETSIEKNKLYMWAALPEIYPMCKWRMIFLNSDFTFLYFTKAKYSIKYTDLLSVSNQAKEANCTIILRNSIVCNPNYHSSFGIYFDAHYQDRLFIGPYFKQHKSDDIETLRYINQSLVCTESFNKMQGKTDYKRGHWLVERPYSSDSGELTIDLTKDTSNTKGAKRKKGVEFPTFAKKQKFSSADSERVIFTQNNDCIKVLDSEPKTPDQFNRYLITNIPHLGYLGAFQHEESSEIDVSWPFENKMLRFPSVSSATEFLQCRFSSLLQPVPETFKINIIVLTQIDLEKTKPIDVSILSGHYICGEFGCYNIKTITTEFCVKNIGTSREDLLRIFAKRAQQFVRQKIDELANVVNIPVSEKGGHDIVSILDKAREDIKSLTELEKRYITEKDDLLLRKRELALKAFCLISALPENEKNAESWKFRQILRKQSILLPKTVVEPIEIIDSDDETKKPSNQKENLITKDVESSIEMLSETLTSEDSSKDCNYGFAEITPLPKLDLTKVSFNKQSDLLKPLVGDKHIPNQIIPTTVATYPPQRKLKSILKSNTTSTISVPTISRVEPSSSIHGQLVSPISQLNTGVDKSSNQGKQHYLTGVKLVKTFEGKLMLVSDNDSVGKPLKFKSAGAKQVLIKNNEVLSVKTIASLKKDNEPNIPESKNTFVKLPNSPPKTIILKKSAILKNRKIFTTSRTLATSPFHKINENNLLKSPPLHVSEINTVVQDNKTVDNIDNLNNDDLNNDKIVKSNIDKNSLLEGSHLDVPEISTESNEHVDNIDDSNNDKIIKSNLIDVTAGKLAINVEGKTSTEIFNNVKRKNPINVGECKPYVENCDSSKFTTISKQICNTISEIGTSSKDIKEQNPTNVNSCDEKDIISENVCLKDDCNVSITQQMIITIKNEKHLKKSSNIEFNEERNKEQTESLSSKSISTCVLKETDFLKSNRASSQIPQSNTVCGNNLDEKNESVLVTNSKLFDPANETTAMEINSNSDDPKESNDQSSNNDSPFLVNAANEATPTEINSNSDDAKESNDQSSNNDSPFLVNAANETTPMEINSNSDDPKESNDQSSNNDSPFLVNAANEATPMKINSNSDDPKESNDQSSNDSPFLVNAANEATPTEINSNSDDAKESNDQSSNNDSPFFVNAANEATPMEINSNSNDPKESNDQSSNNDSPFLVNAVSEIFPVKPGSEMFTNILNKAATLAQLKQAARYNLKDNSLRNKVPKKYDFNADSETDGQNISSSVSEETIGNINQITLTMDFNETILDQGIGTSEESSISLSKNNLDENNSLNNANKDDAELIVYPIIDKEIMDKGICLEQEQVPNATNVLATKEIISRSKINDNLSWINKETTDISSIIANEYTQVMINKPNKIYNSNDLEAIIDSSSRAVTVSNPIGKNSMKKNPSGTSLIDDDNISTIKCNLNNIKDESIVLKKLLLAKNSNKKIIENEIVNKRNKKIAYLKFCELFKQIPSCNFETLQINSICLLKSVFYIKNHMFDTYKKTIKIEKLPKLFNIHKMCDRNKRTLLPMNSRKVVGYKKLCFPISNCVNQKYTSIMKKKMIKSVADNFYNLPQMNANILKPLRTLQNSYVISNKQHILSTIMDNHLVRHTEPYESNVEVILNESNNNQGDLTIIDKIPNTTLAKLPLSKRISNVHVIHFPSNYDSFKENSKQNIQLQDNIIFSTNQQSSSIMKELTLSHLDSNMGHNLVSINCSIKESNYDNKVENNFYINRKTDSKITNISVLKRTSIKCTRAKVDNAFVIDKNSFQGSIGKFKKKLVLNEKGRIRREMITTSDLVAASKIFNSEVKDDKYIAEKICTLAESAIKLKPLKVINKEIFLKNAQLAEKIINVGNMKKKLQANIYENNICQNSSNYETNIENRNDDKIEQIS